MGINPVHLHFKVLKFQKCVKSIFLIMWCHNKNTIPVKTELISRSNIKQLIAYVVGLLFNAGREVEFWEDLGGLSILKAHREKSHVLSRVHRCVLRNKKQGRYCYLVKPPPIPANDSCSCKKNTDCIEGYERMTLILSICIPSVNRVNMSLWSQSPV